MFVLQRLAALGELAELQVASPMPVFPLLSRLRGQVGPACEHWQGLTVHRPRFFYVPGVLKSLDGWFYSRGLQRWLEGLCEQWRPDILDGHFAWPDGVGVALLARKLGLPYSITLRGKIYPCLEVASQRRQCAEALMGAAAVISVSGDMARVAREFGVAEGRLHIIANGVDTERFRLRDKAGARRELGLEQQGKLLVTIAHMGPRKGHREVIRALGQLPENVRLVIVGGDPQGSKNVRELAEVIGEQRLQGRVILAGRQAYDRIPLYLSAADASVLASYREGCPNVVLESLACGRPVVVTRVGAVPDIVKVPDQGRIVPVQDDQALAQALREVLEADWNAEELTRAQSVQSWHSVAERVNSVLIAATTSASLANTNHMTSLEKGRMEKVKEETLQ